MVNNYTNDTEEGGNIKSILENVFMPVRAVKTLASTLNRIRKTKHNTGFLREHDKFLAKIAQDVYNAPNDRKMPGYINDLSNNEVAVYKNNDIIDVAIRGTINKDDVKTDLLLASGFLKNSARYKRNKQTIYNIINNLGYISNITGHSLGGALSQAYGDLKELKNTNVVVFNAGAGITGTYGKKRATFYVSDGDIVSSLGMLSRKHNIRIMPSMNDDIISRHGISNFTGGKIERVTIYDYIGTFKKESLIQFIADIRPNDVDKISKLNKPNIVKWLKDNVTPREIGDIKTFLLRYPPAITKLSYEKKLDLKKLKPQQLQLLETQQKSRLINSMPYQGINPENTFPNNQMAKNLPTIVLQNHQQKLVEAFFGADLHSCVIFHGVGTGKTFTAVALSKLYLQLYPDNKVYFITPSAVVLNMIESIFKYGVDPRDPRFMYFTYDKFYNSNIQTDNAMVIIDEAHNFRTEIKMDVVDTMDKPTEYIFDKNKKGAKLLLSVGMGYKDMLDRQIGPAHKVVALTATPFVNKTYDIENLLAICDGREPIPEDTYGQIVSNFDAAYDYFKYRVSKYTNEEYLSFYPDRREIFVPIVVTDEEDKKQIVAKITCKGPGDCQNSFYIDSRKASIQYDGKKVATSFSSIILNGEKLSNSTNYGVVENIILDAKENFTATRIDDESYLIAESKSSVDYGAIIILLKSVKRKIRNIIEKIK